jgi:hypothetical protein
VRAGVFGAAVLSLSFLLLAAAPSFAQAPLAPPPPLPGFVPPYEVTKIVRSAGFEPLAPPLREGTTYVLRANDFRGILMRVVVDARSGAIRAVNRIVPAYGQVGMMMPPPYGAPSPYGMPPEYSVPAGYGPPGMDGPEMAPEEAGLGLPPPPPSIRPAMHPFVPALPPLPRPRPAELASRDSRAGAKASEPLPPAIKLDAKPNAAVIAPPAAAVTPVAPAAPKRPPPPDPLPD